MVTVGSGEREVQLDEKAITIKQFREIINSRAFQTVEAQELSQFDQALALLRFLDKYECDHAKIYLLEIVEKLIEKKNQQKWPPLLLFLCGAHSNQPTLCEKALNAPVYAWNMYGLVSENCT